ncbi:MAG: xylulokinase [Chloroflexota bacterium]
MPPSLLLAHDLGTTGDKATLFDLEGRALASAFYGYETRYPHPNWAEQNPEDWWQAVCTASHQVIVQAQIAPADIAAVSFSGQMMAAVAVDARANPLRSAIIWADMRAVAQAQRWLDTLGMEATYRITGHRASPSYSGEKMLWVREHQPELFRRVYKFLQAKDFVVARLTGAFVTDRSDASGTNLYDIHAHAWSPQLLDAVGLEASLLPEVHPSAAVVGQVTKQAAEAAGLAAGTPVVIGGGDGLCAAVGAGVVREGMAFNYIGSSSWIGAASAQPLIDPAMRIYTFEHCVPGMYSPNGAMQAAGGAYQWARDVFGLPEKEAAARLGLSPYELLNLQVEKSPPGANGLIFLPYLLGERSPHWNPAARAVFFGLTMRHTRADMLRAVLEGVAFNLRAILDAFGACGLPVDAMRLIGGGAQSLAWRQILADVFGLPVQRPALLAEATSFGAALVGGVGVGLYPDFSVAEQLTPTQDVIEPHVEAGRIYAPMFDLFNRTYQACAPLYAAAG